MLTGAAGSPACPRGDPSGEISRVEVSRGGNLAWAVGVTPPPLPPTPPSAPGLRRVPSGDSLPPPSPPFHGGELNSTCPHAATLNSGCGLSGCPGERICAVRGAGRADGEGTGRGRRRGGEEGGAALGSPYPPSLLQVSSIPFPSLRSVPSGAAGFPRPSPALGELLTTGNNV